MYCITDAQIEYILNDIRRNGVEMEDLQYNLLDHICCIIEQQLKADDDFERFYRDTVKQFYKTELREIEEETINLLTFKNYYAMKKLMIVSGSFSAAAFVMGSLFKTMHWPGASVLLCLAIFSITFIFLPLLYALKSKETRSGRGKLILGLGTFTGVLYALSVLFAVQHWPGVNILWFSTICVSMFAFIPLYFFTGMQRPEAKFNTMVTTVLLVGATGLLFTMMRVKEPPPIQMYMYMKNEQLLKNLQQRNNAAQDNKLISKINNTCEQLKSAVLQEAIGMSNVPRDYESKKIFVRERSIQGTLGYGQSLNLLNQLRASVNEYNASVDEAAKIPADHSILDAPNDQLGAYSNLNLLNNIVQLQMFLANARVSETHAPVAIN